MHLLQWFINFLIKKASGAAATHENKSAIKYEIMSNKELEEELHKAILKNSRKEIYSHFL